MPDTITVNDDFASGANGDLRILSGEMAFLLQGKNQRPPQNRTPTEGFGSFAAKIGTDNWDNGAGLKRAVDAQGVAMQTAVTTYLERFRTFITAVDTFIDDTDEAEWTNTSGSQFDSYLTDTPAS
jgi:hypothetical protein